MTIQNSKFSHDYTVKQILGGYVIADPDGGHVSRLIKFRAEADQLRDKLQRKADKAAKRGPRPCINCQAPFVSEGIHNRMCDKCRGLRDHLGDFATPHATRSARRV
ncbi:MAG: hypothetical protein ACJAYH_001080 [Celeribacter sp.]|jgi:hypothetical protein